MTFSVDVPLNTSLADLDESLRALLLRELGRHGFDGVGVGFDAPTRDWAAKLSRPTVALFLYDIREAETERIAEWDERSGPGGKRSERPPLVVDCSYSITAWTRAVEDEHRLLSQVLGVLCAYREIPRDALAGQLADPGLHPRPVRGRAGRS
ncbi:MAG TPA: DUF4255 domain-containing protein, partial [Baekduia sp.]|nr:DUF4255 domain-containing protein [Baekduia sp.]